MHPYNPGVPRHLAKPRPKQAARLVASRKTAGLPSGARQMRSVSPKTSASGKHPTCHRTPTSSPGSQKRLACGSRTSLVISPSSSAAPGPSANYSASSSKPSRSRDVSRTSWRGSSPLSLSSNEKPADSHESTARSFANRAGVDRGLRAVLLTEVRQNRDQCVPRAWKVGASRPSAANSLPGHLPVASRSKSSTPHHTSRPHRGAAPLRVQSLRGPP